MSNTVKMLSIEMPDGSKWGVPLKLIQDDYVSNYPEDFPDEASLNLLDNDDLVEWAANNMDWDDVKDQAVMLKRPDPVDYQDGWVNGESNIIEVKAND